VAATGVALACGALAVTEGYPSQVSTGFTSSKMEPFARTIDAAKKYVVSPFLLVGRKRLLGPVALPRFQSAKEET
jgi:hypothetical protein